MHPSSLGLLYQIISCAFCVIVVVSNIVSAKMVQLPFFDLIIPAGLATYPLTFFLSDFVTEIYGFKKAKQMIYIALAMNLLSFAIIEFALRLPSPAHEQAAFQAILGLSGLRIFSSLAAYLVAQITDIQLYALIKKWTGPRFLWLRNNGATCISQLIDTIIVDLIFLYWGLGMELLQVIPIICFSYSYKATFNITITPLFYLAVYLTSLSFPKTSLDNPITV